MRKHVYLNSMNRSNTLIQPEEGVWKPSLIVSQKAGFATGLQAEVIWRPEPCSVVSEFAY